RRACTRECARFTPGSGGVRGPERRPRPCAGTSPARARSFRCSPARRPETAWRSDRRHSRTCAPPRSVRVRHLAAQALAALAAAGTTAYAARGVALAATVYESWSLRHCHDVDILVPAAEQERAVRALAGAGFHGGPRRPRPAAGRGAV